MDDIGLAHIKGLFLISDFDIEKTTFLHTEMLWLAIFSQSPSSIENLQYPRVLPPSGSTSEKALPSGSLENQVESVFSCWIAPAFKDNASLFRKKNTVARTFNDLLDSL